MNGGCYVLFVPDKRFRFVNNVSESSVADVLDDHVENGGRGGAGHHTLRSVIEHRVLTSPNEPTFHWGRTPILKRTPDPKSMAAPLHAAWKEYEQNRYV